MGWQRGLPVRRNRLPRRAGKPAGPRDRSQSPAGRGRSAPLHAGHRHFSPLHDPRSCRQSGGLTSAELRRSSSRDCVGVGARRGSSICRGSGPGDRGRRTHLEQSVSITTSLALAFHPETKAPRSQSHHQRRGAGGRPGGKSLAGVGHQAGPRHRRSRPRGTPPPGRGAEGLQAAAREGRARPTNISTIFLG